MVNTRIDADLSAAVQNALQTLLPQIREDVSRRLAGFLGAAAGTDEEQAKNFQWGLR
nr:hypothetical protein [Tanacetum cinerariifolium]